MSRTQAGFAYDIAVIGGGSGGYAAARTAASEGLKTVVVEGGREVGGLCILRGCMPTKALLSVDSACGSHWFNAAPACFASSTTMQRANSIESSAAKGCLFTPAPGCSMPGAWGMGRKSPSSGELIHEIIAAMHNRMTVHALAAMPHYHPTLAEIWTYPAEELKSFRWHRKRNLRQMAS